MRIVNAVIGAMVVSAAMASPSLAQADYWHKIEKAIVDAGQSPEAARNTDVYIRSLSREQLILAGRQCSIVMMEKYAPDKWDEAEVSLSFFFEYFPVSDDALVNLTPIWRELHDNGAPLFWRRALVYLLTHTLSGRLRHEQVVDVITHLTTILDEPSSPVYLRKKIPVPLARFMVAEHKRVGAPGVIDEAFSDIIKKESNGYMRLFGEVTTPVEIKHEVLAGMMCFFRANSPGSNEIKVFVERQFVNYEGIDCKLWLQLANYGSGELALPHAREIIDGMKAKIPQRIQDAQDVRDQLMRFRAEPRGSIMKQRNVGNLRG